MTAALSAEDFPAFFTEVWGYAPFPWQARLMHEVARTGRWPERLDLPTGAGKTAALDIALFHLALEAQKGPERTAPLRIALVVDRRLVVDDAFRRAQDLAAALRKPQGPVTTAVAERLYWLAGAGGPSLAVHRLRGGVPREPWARSPVQPMILCATVDQIGSRLLFRGYGVSDSAKPIHAGLVGADCLILLDEAHLSRPFEETLEWVAHYRSPAWRAPGRPASPWGVVRLSATPGADGGVFGLDAADRDNAVLAARILASKPARLELATKSRGGRTATDAVEDDADVSPEADDDSRIEALVVSARRVIADLRSGGVEAPAVAVVVNRVRRAREVFERIKAEVPDAVLMIGPVRPVDRDAVVAQRLEGIRTGAKPRPERPLAVVATQCLEVGVDLDFDGLVTELAPIDALRQRFGRLNRAGRDIPGAAGIVASSADIAGRAKPDPVYGRALPQAWAYLQTLAAGGDTVDFGVDAFEQARHAAPVPPEALTPKLSAPVLMPAHLDLLSETWPVPAADPEVALYLHGPQRQPAAVTLLWRADIREDDPPEQVGKRLKLMPPRAGEILELPKWVVQRWLEGSGVGGIALADTPGDEPEALRRTGADPRRAFRLDTNAEEAGWVYPSQVRAGDRLVVPAAYGGLDAFGWVGSVGTGPVEDKAQAAAAPFNGKVYAMRVAPGLLDVTIEAPANETNAQRAARGRRQIAATRALEDRVRAVIALTGSRSAKRLSEALLAIEALPDAVREALHVLSRANGGWRAVQVHTDPYEAEAEEETTVFRGAIFVACKGIKATGSEFVAEYDSHLGPPEDDLDASLQFEPVLLSDHTRAVEAAARTFAERAGLATETADDIVLAATLHDLGKADPRFQAWLAFGDPLTGAEELLAKSGRPIPPGGRPLVGLPDGWRHEALSVRLAPLHPAFGGARDPELVLWLIGTHHGRGRPFFPGHDGWDETQRTLILPSGPVTLPPAPGPQSPAYDWRGFGWADLHVRLKRRYGVFELARFEAILRLADWWASEQTMAPAKRARSAA